MIITRSDQNYILLNKRNLEFTRELTALKQTLEQIEQKQIDDNEKVIFDANENKKKLVDKISNN